MPFEDLSLQQQTFIERYLKKGFRSKSKNKKIIGKYEDYLVVEKQFKDLVSKLSPADPTVKDLVARAHPALSEKKDGKFVEAGDLLGEVVVALSGLADTITAGKNEIRRRIAGFPDPVGSTPAEIAAAKVFRDTVSQSMAEEFPAPDKLAAADAALVSLGKLIVQTQANIGIRNRRQDLVRELGTLKDPAAASTAQKAAMKKDRDAATAALAADLPTETNFKAAETAIRSLRNRISEVAALAKFTTAKPNSGAKAATVLGNLNAVLGDMPVGPAVVAEMQSNVLTLQKPYYDSWGELGEAKKLPDGTDEEKAAKTLAVAAAQQKFDAAQVAHNDALKLQKAAKAKLELLDSMSVGPLSDMTPPPLNDTQTLAFVGAFESDPGFGIEALKLVKTSKDPAKLAARLPKMSGNIDSGFADSTGKHFTDKEYSGTYAANLLKMGEHIDDPFFDDLDDYVKSGAQFETKPFGNEPRGTNARSQHRAKAVGKALLDGGELKTDTPAAKAAFGHAMFHPSTVEKPTPSLSKHMMETMQVFKDPTKGPKCAKIIKDMPVPTSDAGKAILGKTVGEDPAGVGKADAQAAVLSAMMTPIDQGPVGSCFTTAPARRFRETNPDKVMEGFAEVATKGQLTSASGLKVNAVAVDKLPDNGDNPLLRSWEYSVASVAATQAGSRERTLLRGSMMSGEGLGKVKDIVGNTDWPTAKSKLETAIGNAYIFQYDPTIKIKSNDGSSSTGRYVILAKDNWAGPKGVPIITKEAFITSMTLVALKALDLEDSSENGVKVVNLVKSDSFINAVCSGKRKPWELSSGGMELGPTQALFGGTPSTDEYIDAVPEGDPRPNEGARSEEVLNNLLGAVDGHSERYLNIGTAGIHSFNALPEEGMKDLIGATPAETAQNVKDTLIDPGAVIAATKVPAEKAAYMFDKMVESVIEGTHQNDMKQELLTIAAEKRPSEDMTPAEIKAAFKEAVKEITKKKAKIQVDYNVADLEKEIKARKDAAKIKDGDAFDETKFDADALAEVEALRLKKEASWNEYYDKKMDGTASSEMMADLDVPSVTIADTNWGNGETHTFFVMAPDPTTGELRLWKRTEPGGAMTPEDRKWVDTAWDKTE